MFTFIVKFERIFLEVPSSKYFFERAARVNMDTFQSYGLYTDGYHKHNITANPPPTVKKIDSWLLQLPVLLSAIGSLNPAADFTSSDWTCGTFNVS
jgi:hypothetical protein